MAEGPRPLPIILRRAAAPILITAAILANSPGAAQAPLHPSPPVKIIGPSIETLGADHGAGAYPIFTTADLMTGSATAR